MWAVIGQQLSDIFMNCATVLPTRTKNLWFLAFQMEIFVLCSWKNSNVNTEEHILPLNAIVQEITERLKEESRSYSQRLLCDFFAIASLNANENKPVCTKHWLVSSVTRTASLVRKSHSQLLTPSPHNMSCYLGR